jgi:hypothetical protein
MSDVEGGMTMTDTKPANDTNAWADSYGRWHASVPLTGNALADANKARARIIAELTEREGPNFAPSSVHVTRTEVCTKVTGRHTVIYSERVDD